MSMASEIATESTIRAICRDIEKALTGLDGESHELERAGLKTAGRIAMQHFEWSTPPWTAYYEELFQE